MYVVLTGVAKVAIDFEKPTQRTLDRITVSEAQRYLAETTGVLPALLAANPQLREDYEALVAAARRTRQ